MTNTTLTFGIEVFTILWLAILSISHVTYPNTWARFFMKLRELGHIGAFANGFLALTFGSIIVALHNVWSWPGIVVTLIGWSQVVKALVGFVLPHVAVKGFGFVSPDKAWRFRASGAVMLILTVWLGYLLYASWAGVIS